MKNLFLLVVFMFIANITNAQWEPDVRLTNDPAKSYISGASQRNIASIGDFVHVVWHEARDKNWEIYYKRSSDGGVTWGADSRLTDQFSTSDYPSIAVSGLTVHVVWEDDRDGNFEIYYKRSTDGGVTWGADTRLTNAPNKSYQPSAGVSGSVVSIVWYEYRDGNSEIYYKRSTDSGATWEADMRLTNDSANSFFPSVAVSGSLVHVVWSDYRDVDEEIYYKRSTDDGATWGTDKRITNSAGYSDYPCIAASGSDVHAVWYDFREGGDSVSQIYYKHSADGGLTWEADTRLTNDPKGSDYASVAVSGSVVHLVWNDKRDGGKVIYYKRSTDGGGSWGADARLTNNQSSGEPTVTASGSVVHVVWQDGRDGANGEIYYKRNPTGNTTGIKEINSEIPEGASLSQNYPNPFNMTTNFEFQVTKFGLVNISVYDVFGKVLTTLLNEQINPGSYEVKFDTGNLTPGVYYLTMKTGNSTGTKKFVIVR